MLGLIRQLSRLRGPIGVLALAVGLGAFTGLVAAHLVLAGWTYRNASRRDLRDPGRWALGVLVGGVFVFAPYVAIQRASDWSADSRALGAARRARGRAGRAAEAPSTGTDGERELTRGGTDERDLNGAGTDEPDEATVDPSPTDEGGSLAVTSARYGWKAVRFGSRGAGRVARMAYRQLAD